MKLYWLFPDMTSPYPLLSGDFYVTHQTNSHGPLPSYSVVRDRMRGYNVLRVDWTQDDPVTDIERDAIMETLLKAAEIKYEQLKEAHGTTV